MSTIRYYAPAGVQQFPINGVMMNVGAAGYIEADIEHAPDFLRAGFTPRTEQSVVVEDGVVIANIIPRTGTLAALMALAGGNGEIAVPTDTDKLVVQFPGGTKAIGSLYANATNVYASGDSTAPEDFPVYCGFRPKMILAFGGCAVVPKFSIGYATDPGNQLNMTQDGSGINGGAFQSMLEFTAGAAGYGFMTLLSVDDIGYTIRITYGGGGATPPDAITHPFQGNFIALG